MKKIILIALPALLIAGWYFYVRYDNNRLHHLYAGAGHQVLQRWGRLKKALVSVFSRIVCPCFLELG